MKSLAFAVARRLQPDKYLLNKDGISPRMRRMIVASTADVGVGGENRSDKFREITLKHASTLEDVLVGAMLRGTPLGQEIINSRTLIDSFQKKEVMDWVSLLAERDASTIIRDAKAMFDEITKGTQDTDREPRAKRLFDSGYIRLEQLEKLFNSGLRKEEVHGGLKEAPRF